VVEVREVLRGWLEGAGLRRVAERAGVDRRTARRYAVAAQAAGLSRDAGRGAVDDVLVGAVVAAVPGPADSFLDAWQRAEAWADRAFGSDGPKCRGSAS
jgi:hypothetical protein